MNNHFDVEIRLKLLNLLKRDPQLTQREMNQKMGVSLGKVNYCITAFVKRGIVKVEKFKNRKNKNAYIYHLTPKGIEMLGVYTLSFLKLKIKEYDGIKEEIRMLSEQISKIDPQLYDDPKLSKWLEKFNDISLDS